MAKCENLGVTLKKRVAIQKLARTSDGQGGFTEAWETVGSAACSIDPYKGYERFQAGQMATPVTHKIVMRFNREVTTFSRLVYAGRVFHIKEAINQSEGNRFLIIKAIETGEKTGGTADLNWSEIDTLWGDLDENWAA